MNRTCPQPVELYEYVDGELSRDAWSRVDRHLPGCSHCRDEVRSIARLNRELHAPAKQSLPDDFEVRFKRSLYARMVTSNETVSRRRVVSAGRVAAFAAGLLVSVILWRVLTHDGVVSPAEEGENVAIVSTAESSEVDRAFAAFHRSVTTRPTRGQVRRLKAAVEACGINVVAGIRSRLERGTPRERRSLLRSLAMLDEAPADALLVSAVRRSPAGTPEHEDALAVLDHVDVDCRARVALGEYERGVDFDRVLALVSDGGEGVAKDAVTAICNEHVRVEPGRVVRALAAMPGEHADRLLLDFHLDGIQSESLVRSILERPQAVRRAAGVASRRGRSDAVRGRALRLLGASRDPAYVSLLADLAKNRGLAGDALAALALIGSEDALLELAHGLAVGGGSVADRSPVAAARENAIATLGPAALDFYLERAENGPVAHRRRYVRAVGLLGDASIVERLYALSRQDDLRLAVTEALGRLEIEEARPFLEKLARDPRSDVRRAARRALRRLGATGERPWRGFARSHPSGFIAHLA